MIWVVIWLLLIALHGVAIWGLWTLTGYWHSDDRAIRRLCMICWLLILLVFDVSVNSMNYVVTVFARLVTQSN